LDSWFREAIKAIRKFPRTGKTTNDPAARVKVVGDYLIIYEENAESIVILTIWDSLQDQLVWILDMSNFPDRPYVRVPEFM
jgi:predicted nucleotide-binding protein (sugar kinase/HSP70/actin superfamily)